MVASAIIFSPFVIMSGVLPIMPRMRFIGLWAKFISMWLRITCKINYRVDGLEHLPNSPVVVLSKHQSAWETIVFQNILPPHTWALKREALWIPFFGWGLAATKPIAINRRKRYKALDQLIAQGVERLAEGRWVVIFPEGSRMTPGQQGSYSPGGAMLAIKAGVPIIPIAQNAGVYWGRRKFKKYPGTISVCIGPAIETRGKKIREVNKKAETWIENKMKTFVSEF